MAMVARSPGTCSFTPGLFHTDPGNVTGQRGEGEPDSKVTKGVTMSVHAVFWRQIRCAKCANSWCQVEDLPQAWYSQVPMMHWSRSIFTNRWFDFCDDHSMWGFLWDEEVKMFWSFSHSISDILNLVQEVKSSTHLLSQHCSNYNWISKPCLLQLTSHSSLSLWAITARTQKRTWSLVFN